MTYCVVNVWDGIRLQLNQRREEVMNLQTLYRTFSVLSGNPADLEAGFEPNLEAQFGTLDEAEEFARVWNEQYDDTNFWVKY